MHPYYQQHRAKFQKDLDGFLKRIARELEAATGQPFPRLREEIQRCYEEDFLERFPYIGGSKSNGTRNMTGAFGFVAMGEVCRRYGVSLEQWGRLTTLCYQRYFAQVPEAVWVLCRALLARPALARRVLCRMDAKNAANAKANPGSFVTQTQPSTEEYPLVYHMLFCPLAKFARTYGYMEYMPYICNLDYVTFEQMQVPFYRSKTCAAGDGCCDFKLKAGAPVNPAWPCHGVTPGDPLK